MVFKAVDSHTPYQLTLALQKEHKRKELPFWALFFSLEDEADIANTTHFCDVWKRQEFKVLSSVFGHS